MGTAPAMPLAEELKGGEKGGDRATIVNANRDRMVEMEQNF
jgi:hypothetical protein